MALVLLLVLLPFFGIFAYVGFVLHKKRVKIQDVRVRNVKDVQKLLSFPVESSLKYLDKVA